MSKASDFLELPTFFAFLPLFISVKCTVFVLNASSIAKGSKALDEMKNADCVENLGNYSILRNIVFF